MATHLRIYSSLLMILLFTLCISACAANNNHRAVNRGNARVIIEKGTNRVYKRAGSYSLQTPGLPVATVTPAANNTVTEERSQKIARAVTGLKAIKSASVVITGNTAIVGVKTDSLYDDSELIDIKRMVEEKVKTADKGIDHVSVTTAIDLVGRINRMPDAGSSEDPPLAGPDDFVPRG